MSLLSLRIDSLRLPALPNMAGIICGRGGTMWIKCLLVQRVVSVLRRLVSWWLPSRIGIRMITFRVNCFMVGVKIGWWARVDWVTTLGRRPRVRFRVQMKRLGVLRFLTLVTRLPLLLAQLSIVPTEVILLVVSIFVVIKGVSRVTVLAVQ